MNADQKSTDVFAALSPAAEDELRVIADSLAMDDGAWQPTFDNLRLVVERTLDADRAWRKERQRNGIEVARKRGVKLGRPTKDIPREFVLVYERWLEGSLSTVKAADELGVSTYLFRRWVASWQSRDEQA